MIIDTLHWFGPAFPAVLLICTVTLTLLGILLSAFWPFRRR